MTEIDVWENLNKEDCETIEAALFHYSKIDGETVQRIVTKLHNLGFYNKVPWGHQLSEYVSNQINMIYKKKLEVFDFIIDIDENFSYGRDINRTGFIESVKKLATKIGEDK